jgi:hypothetical protein
VRHTFAVAALSASWGQRPLARPPAVPFRGALHLSEPNGDARPDTLIHVYFDDIEAVSREFGVPIDEAGLAGRECDFADLTATGCA